MNYANLPPGHGLNVINGGSGGSSSPSSGKCLFVGTAYDGLKSSSSPSCDIICAKTVQRLNELNHAAGGGDIRCSYDVSTAYKDILYRDEAVRLSVDEARRMPIAGGPLHEEHGDKRVGTVKECWITDDDSQLKIVGISDDPSVAHKVKTGEYNAMSIRYWLHRFKCSR